MTGAKILMASAAGLAAIDGISPDTAMSWEKMGIVGLLLVAIVVIYRDGRKRQDKLEIIIESNTKAFTEVSDAIKGCPRREK